MKTTTAISIKHFLTIKFICCSPRRLNATAIGKNSCDSVLISFRREGPRILNKSKWALSLFSFSLRRFQNDKCFVRVRWMMARLSNALNGRWKFKRARSFRNGNSRGKILCGGHRRGGSVSDTVQLIAIYDICRKSDELPTNRDDIDSQIDPNLVKMTNLIFKSKCELAICIEMNMSRGIYGV